MSIKRTVFISYYGNDETKVTDFITNWAKKRSVFIPKVLGVSDKDDIINSNDSDYVMRQIRQNYLGDSTVTIVLVGTCTHSRRYVDLEIKSSLTQGENHTPNGLIAIFLNHNNEILPKRLADNFNPNKTSYAKCYSQPKSAQELRGWIEDAFEARIGRAKFITNSQNMMKYNEKCQICELTHNNSKKLTINQGSESDPITVKIKEPWRS